MDARIVKRWILVAAALLLTCESKPKTPPTWEVTCTKRRPETSGIFGCTMRFEGAVTEGECGRVMLEADEPDPTADGRCSDWVIQKAGNPCSVVCTVPADGP